MYNQKQHLHFIGIGGVGMAGIAEIVCNLGYKVSGSDMNMNALGEHLVKLGCEVTIGHDAAVLSETVTAVVKSSAIPESNPELKRARELSIPIISRAAMLAELMRMKYGIAVAGSHGKTTTTSMTARVLTEVGLDPTVVVGGRVLNQATGAKLGMGQYFVAEADESDGSFCLLRPAIAVVTNIDYEHMGHYGDFETLKKAFRDFLSTIPFYGLIGACIDDPAVRAVIEGIDRRVLTYGTNENADIRARDFSVEDSKTRFILSVNNCDISHVSLPLAGEHMILNALAAIGIGIELGAYPDEAIRALEDFPGVSRRTEVLDSVSGVLFMDDYGHHPTEIKATLAGIRKNFLPSQLKTNGTGKIHVMFEPHRYSRTKEIFSDFSDAFDDADIVYISEIYAAGEKPVEGISGELLAKSLNHKNVSYLENFSENSDKILNQLKAGDILVTLGAGAIGKLGSVLIEQYANS